MERLTAIAPNGMAYLVKVKPSEQEVESPYPNTLNCILESFKRLAEYEDTGLTPQQIQDDIRVFTDSWKEKLDEVKKERDYWEREAKKYCAELGEQKIKLQKLKCEMCKDVGNCREMLVSDIII